MMSTINFLSGDPSLPASWQGGVLPTSNDVAAFTASSGACTLTSAAHWGGISASGYANTFTSSGYSITLEASGFQVPAVITGTFDVSGTTITNNGTMDFRGMQNRWVINAGTKWIQNGGTQSAPNLMYAGAGATGFFPFAFTLSEGAWLTTYQSFYLIGDANVVRDIVINGTLDMQGSTGTFYRADLSIGNNGSIVGTNWLFLYWLNSLSGSVQNIKVNLLRSRANSFTQNLLFASNVEIVHYGSDAATVNWSGSVTFAKSLTITNSPYSGTSIPFNVNLSNAVVYGDFLVKQDVGAEKSNVTGHVTMAGTADQQVDLTGAANTVNLAAHKPAGLLTLTGGGAATFFEDSEVGSLSLSAGWAGTLSTGGHAIHAAGWNAPLPVSGTLNLSGSVITNTGNYNQAGVPVPNETTVGTTWIQQGGSVTAPNTWTDSAGSNDYRYFDTLIFDAGSVTSCKTPMRLGVKDCRINGTLTTDVDWALDFLLYRNDADSLLTFGPNAVSELPGTFRVTAGSNHTATITGNTAVVTDHIAAYAWILSRNVVVHDCTFAGRVNITRDNNILDYHSTFTNVTFGQNTTVTALGTDPTAETTATFTNVTVLQDFVTKNNGTANLIIYFKNTIAHTIDNKATMMIAENDVLYCETFLAEQNSVLTGKGTLSADIVLRSSDCSDVFSIANLATKATAASLLLLDTEVDLETLHLYDAGGTFVVPKHGYKSLILEAKEKDSNFVLAGKYQVENMQWIANGRRLTIDVTQKPTVGVSGNIRSIHKNGGEIRVVGSGTDHWVFNGPALQTVGLELEYGYHVLHLFVNAKSSGSLVIESPMIVYDYIAADGKKLDALENLTVISRIQLLSRLHFVLEGTNQHFSQEGVCLENGKIPVRGNVVFFMRLSDAGKRPVNPEWIEYVTLRCLMMNPVSPYLHPPRKILIDDLLLRTDEIFSGEFETGNVMLPDDETFNGSLCSSEIESLRFEEPGLYHVSFGVKLFGHKTPVTLRYEIYCDREA